MPRPRRRKPVVSDPDHAPRPGGAGGGERGIAVNTGTDPQRPGMPPEPVPDSDPPGTSAQETSVTTNHFGATHQPATPGRSEDVEGGGQGGPADAL